MVVLHLLPRRAASSIGMPLAGAGAAAARPLGVAVMRHSCALVVVGVVLPPCARGRRASRGWGRWLVACCVCWAARCWWRAASPGMKQYGALPVRGCSVVVRSVRTGCATTGSGCCTRQLLHWLPVREVATYRHYFSFSSRSFRRNDEGTDKVIIIAPISESDTLLFAVSH